MGNLSRFSTHVSGIELALEKMFVCPVDDVIRIRTGETGAAADLTRRFTHPTTNSSIFYDLNF